MICKPPVHKAVILVSYTHLSPVVLAPWHECLSLTPSWATTHQLQMHPYKRAVLSDLHGFPSKGSFKSGQRLNIFFHKYLLSTWCRNVPSVLPWAASSPHRRKTLFFITCHILAHQSSTWLLSKTGSAITQKLSFCPCSLLLSFLCLTASTFRFLWWVCVWDRFLYYFIFMLLSSLGVLLKMAVRIRTGKVVCLILSENALTYLYI